MNRSALVLLELESLKVWFRSRSTIKGSQPWLKAVDGVSFAIEKGQSIGLVGESGSGKSTIGRSIVKLQSVTSGSIRLKGRDVCSLKGRFEEMAYRKSVQMVFQDPYHTLNPRMTIRSILEEPLKLHFKAMNAAERLKKVCLYLCKVGLDESSLVKYPHQFSGGQRQRIGVARALMVEPELIICDEAVSALDVSVQAQIVNLFQDLQDEFGFALLFIAHDLAVVEHLCDHVLVMHRGKIVEEGNPVELYQNPKHEYTQKLLDAVPKMPALA